jgi:hypothetical protein
MQQNRKVAGDWNFNDPCAMPVMGPGIAFGGGLAFDGLSSFGAM